MVIQIGSITDLNEYRERKMRPKGKLVKIPMYSRVYMEGNKLIGEFESGSSEVIKIYEE